jgi:hypothetical protein
MLRSLSRFFPILFCLSVASYGCNKSPTTSSNEEDESSSESNSRSSTYRAAPTPTGTFSVQIQRIPLHKPGLANFSLRKPILSAISDNGVLLYQFDPFMSHEYYVVSEGIQQTIKRTDNDPVPYLMPNGQIKMINGVSSISDRFSSSYPHSLDRMGKLLYNDGSFLQVGVANLPGQKRATYTLDREWHNSARQPSFTRTPFVTKLKSEVIYQANNPVIPLEKTEKNVIWIQDHNGTESRGVDKLIRYENGNIQEVPMPDGYRNVQRVAQTGDHVAATFGIIRGDMPYRAYKQTKSGWMELPIPKGYDFSFAEKVFRDGTILGFVTTADTKKIQYILWRNDKLVVLNDQPGWPNAGSISVCVLANRNGLISVQDYADERLQRGTQYLLQLTVR